MTQTNTAILPITTFYVFFKNIISDHQRLYIPLMQIFFKKHEAVCKHEKHL